MSSLIRRLQIRMMKRAGYTREKWIIVADPVNGQPRIKNVRRGGEITDNDGTPIGRRWPQFMPPRSAA
jgi:hypothetical protein